MFEKLPRHPRIRRFLMDIFRRGRFMRDRYRDAGYTACEVRGIKLLREWLSPQQLVQFNKYRYFEVTGCHTGRRYRIRYGQVSNIWNSIPTDIQKLVGVLSLMKDWLRVMSCLLRKLD